MNDYAPHLQPFGISADVVIELQPENPAHLPYAAILKARSNTALLNHVRCVVTWQGGPLAYIIDGVGLADDDARRLRRILALRGDAPYLGLLSGGTLTVLRLAIDTATLQDATLKVFQGDDHAEAIWAYSRLSAGWDDADAPNARRGARVELTRVIRDLLDTALNVLVSEQGGGAHPEDGLSIVGRALFARFLADRRLLPPEWLAKRDTLFDDPASAQAVSDWLDSTFNGNLLPLTSADPWASLTPASWYELGNILRGTPGGQLSLDWAEDWRHIDLAHVPVGVLSEVYEGFAHRVDKRDAHTKGVYYTPWRIAERMVGEAFAALRREGRAVDARVLDPAAGAGVFLHITFRQLVYERLRAGQTVNTGALRHILRAQLQGFDLSEGALRFAALGLYLLAIELDPEPEPVTKLVFPDLRETTLRRVADARGGGPGSLGPLVGPEHEGQYDLVVGNPPWTTGGAGAAWEIIAEGVNAVANTKLKRVTVLPNRAPDLAFLWRGLGWARPGGQIALALHGRLLHQQTMNMPTARADLWEAATVTGVIDGARVRETGVWERVREPFCLLFVKNSPPSRRSGCLVTALEEEPRLNAEGRFRLSTDDSTWILPAEVRHDPHLFKVLLRGTAMDQEVMRRLEAKTTVGAYWRALQDHHGERGLVSGKGASLSVPRADGGRGGATRGSSSAGLHGLPVLNKDTPTSLQVVWDDAPRFDAVEQPTVDRAREPALWAPPQMIVRKSVLAGAAQLTAMVNLSTPVAFDQTYFGWSAAGHPEGPLLVKALTLQLRSKIALWSVLMRSGTFGVERDRIEKESVESAPVVGLEDMTEAQRAEVEPLYDRLSEAPESSPDWRALDEWAAGLYELGPRDLDVIQDTLAMSSPSAASVRRAKATVTFAQQRTFLERVSERLNGWAKTEGKSVEVEALALPAEVPWRACSVRCPEVDTGAGEGVDWSALLAMLDTQDASELIFQAALGRLIIIRLPYQRGWTGTRAHLLVRRIIHQHLDHLLGGEPQ